MDNIRESLNKHLKAGRIILTRPGMLSQCFETSDGRIKVSEKRIGGGFICGRTLTFISLVNETPRQVTLTQAYYETLMYLEE